MTVSNAKVWLITGASRGLGKAFTEAALAQGDRVVAAARNVEPLKELTEKYPSHLVPQALDVTDRRAVFAGAEQAAAVFGRLDVVVNNAGAMLYGMVEEATEEQIRAHMEVNFFGAVWVAQAVLPLLRTQGGGRLLQVTSMGSGGGMATVGFYGAGKAALDSVSEALAMEAEGFGVKVTIVQMGGYNTGLFTTGTTTTQPLEPYQSLRTEMEAMWGDAVAPEPDTAAPVIMKLAALPDPPRRLIVGSQSFDHVLEMDQAQADLYRSWEHLSRIAPG
ncbi:SDR family NAD(P)-dependent oxidoreductase [Streptomyces sp. p1417]|uniref:SDR family NAD(P)-dependent oxidoreductase n=1 Tax=Streptomyces typhae TaxID=2681492 RepID=A0A6L6WRS7_9ACTN|nr:SDR family NAD(P)-dependent oxidoreductase [Streptomyces typhae]MVO84975.1 SDR family NAD(P)-dependent oxidoreductase [Streptomyces typhae]